jgi:hypothetical protein
MLAVAYEDLTVEEALRLIIEKAGMLRFGSSAGLSGLRIPLAPST